jgi:hypothetical protein
MNTKNLSRLVLAALALALLVSAMPTASAQGPNCWAADGSKQPSGTSCTGTYSLTASPTPAPCSDPNDPTCKIEQGFGKITAMIKKFVTPLLALTLLIAGFAYIFTGGNERARATARGIAIAAFVGGLLAYNAPSIAKLFESWFG